MRGSRSESAYNSRLFWGGQAYHLSNVSPPTLRSGRGNLSIIVGFVCGVWLLLAASHLRAANGKLEVTFFDVGQADAILVTCPDGNHHLLIDSGDTRYPKSSKNFRAFLANAFAGKSNHLDIVVASHAHTDHIGSMEWVLTNFRVDTYVDNGDASAESTTFGKLQKERLRQTKAGKLNYIKGSQNSFSELDFCPSVKMQIFLPWATKPSLADPNDRSVAVRLDHGQKSFLFVGDIEGEAESVMLNQFTADQRDRLNVNVLKVGHHGSDTSSSAGFVMAVSPEIAVVSVGKKDTGTNVGYKHPRLSTLRTYEDWFNQHQPAVTNNPVKIAAYDGKTGAWKQQTRPKGMWLTVKDGTITVTSDGHDLKVSAAPTPD